MAAAIVSRRANLLVRATAGALVALIGSRLVGWGLAGPWAAVFFSTLALDVWLWRPYPARRLPRWRTALGLLAIGANAATFNAISIPLWENGDAVGGICAVSLMTAAALNAVLVSRRSRIVLAFALAPNFAFMTLTVGFAGAFGALPAFQRTLGLCCLVLAGYALALWRALDAGHTAEIAARREVEDQARRLDLTLAAKSEFVATLSAHLHAPIQAILAQTERVKSGERDAAGAADAIAAQAHRLQTLLDDALDQDRLDSGQVVLERRPVALRDLVAEAAGRWRDKAASRGVDLAVAGADTLPCTVLGDARRLSQMLNTLLANAVRATDAGVVTLELRAWPCGDRACALSLAVSDSGPGLTAAEAATVFQPRSTGSALGLAIGARLARAMGGRLTARGRPGQGSTFTLSLTLPLIEAGRAERELDDRLDQIARAPLGPPLRLAPAPASSGEVSTLAETPFLAEAPSPEAPAGHEAAEVETRDEDQAPALRVLVVDDHEINRRAVELVLTPTGASITTAVNGRQALDLALVQVFDLIVMDVRMPEMNGREATRLLRSQPGPNRHVPVIAVTADSEAQDIEACREAGMNWFLAKPIDPAKLIETAIQALDEAEQARAARTEADARAA
jgi:signal transduction histidine kinase/AmiR/NasT family two-component response regulator